MASSGADGGTILVGGSSCGLGSAAGGDDASSKSLRTSSGTRPTFVGAAYGSSSPSGGDESKPVFSFSSSVGIGLGGGLFRARQA